MTKTVIKINKLFTAYFAYFFIISELHCFSTKHTLCIHLHSGIYAVTTFITTSLSLYIYFLANKMAPVDGDVKRRCVIVCAILSVLLFERTLSVYIRMIVRTCCTYCRLNCEYRPKLLYFSDDLSRDNTQRETKGRTFQRDSTHRSSRKRGRREGVLTRFRRRNLRPPLPAIVLTNARSLKNKTDELFQLMSFKREFKDASVLCITETWLDPLTPDTAVTAPGHILFSADRCPVLSQKEKGGGVCFLVNHRWCNDGKLVS